MQWAKEHDVSHFGSVVDKRMRADFIQLGIGVQPTEETLDSSGVKQFRRKVLEYQASLKLDKLAVSKIKC